MTKGWTQVQLGKQVSLTHSVISRFETGDNIPPADVAKSLDSALGANGRLLDFWDQLNDNPDSAWVRKFFNLESRATKVHQIAELIPPLLQNDSYTRSILQQNLAYYGGNLEEKVRFREQRRALLRKSPPLALSVVLGEAALHTVVGDDKVMRQQLLDLIDLTAYDHIEVRVRPFDGMGHAYDGGSLVIFRLQNGDSAVYRPGGLRGLYVTSPATVAEYVTLYDHLNRDALDAEASRILIRKVVEERYPCPPLGKTIRP